MRRARREGLADRIETHCADMKAPDLGDETFDLVLGRGVGLSSWVFRRLCGRGRSFLKPGGAAGLHRAGVVRGWCLRDECREFFAIEYPRMTDVASHQATIDECGHDLVGRFKLPESSWWESFYGPLAERLGGYEAPWDDDETQAFLGQIRREIDVYRRFSRWYGYVFFLLRMRS